MGSRPVERLTPAECRAVHGTQVAVSGAIDLCRALGNLGDVRQPQRAARLGAGLAGLIESAMDQFDAALTGDADVDALQCVTAAILLESLALTAAVTQDARRPETPAQRREARRFVRRVMRDLGLGLGRGRGCASGQVRRSRRRGAGRPGVRRRRATRAGPDDDPGEPPRSRCCRRDASPRPRRWSA